MPQSDRSMSIFMIGGSVCTILELGRGALAPEKRNIRTTNLRRLDLGAKVNSRSVDVETGRDKVYTSQSKHWHSKR